MTRVLKETYVGCVLFSTLALMYCKNSREDTIATQYTLLLNSQLKWSRPKYVILIIVH